MKCKGEVTHRNFLNVLFILLLLCFMRRSPFIQPVFVPTMKPTRAYISWLGAHAITMTCQWKTDKERERDTQVPLEVVSNMICCEYAGDARPKMRTMASMSLGRKCHVGSMTQPPVVRKVKCDEMRLQWGVCVCLCVRSVTSISAFCPTARYIPINHV